MLEYLATMETADDRTRFESLYLAYRGLMYHVAYHILKNPQDAEDAVHQSFVKLAEHMATIPDGPCPRTRNLVVTVAERKAIDLYRSRQVRNFFGFCGRCESAEMLRIAGEKSDANSTIHISSGKVSQNTVLGKHVLRTGFEYGS